MGFVWGEGPSASFGGQKSNSGSFNSNPYQNPQMGAYGGGPPGWGNQNSMMYDWQNSFAPPESAWVGAAPGQAGRDYSYNPQTGQGGWMNTAGGLQVGGSNPYGSGAISWTDPYTGMKAINPDALMKLFGGMGGGGYKGYDMTDFQGGQMTAPGAYGGGDWSSPYDLSTEEVIESYRPMMQNEIDQGFAQAGNRLGASGFAMSTPYAQTLGQVSDLATAKMNNQALQYGYDASKFDRDQALARQMAQNAEGFNAWQQGGNWDMQAQSGNMNNAMQQWMMENQIGLQNNQGQNQYGQSQQQMLMALLQGLL